MLSAAWAAGSKKKIMATVYITGGATGIGATDVSQCAAVRQSIAAAAAALPIRIMRMHWYIK